MQRWPITGTTEVLFEAAEQADCIAHLALVTLWQSGAAEGGYEEYSYGYGRGRGYHWSDDEDDSDYDDTSSDYEMGELYDWSLTANHWSDREGNQVLLGEMRLEENEIVADEPLQEAEPNREDFGRDPDTLFLGHLNNLGGPGVRKHRPRSQVREMLAISRHRCVPGSDNRGKCVRPAPRMNQRSSRSWQKRGLLRRPPSSARLIVSSGMRSFRVEGPAVVPFGQFKIVLSAGIPPPTRRRNGGTNGVTLREIFAASGQETGGGRDHDP